jgi:hypothetical protein
VIGFEIEDFRKRFLPKHADIAVPFERLWAALEESVRRELGGTEAPIVSITVPEQGFVANIAGMLREMLHGRLQARPA